jgi:hypothetical protein
MVDLNGCGGGGPTLRGYPGICLEGLQKTIINLTQHSQALH